MCGDEEARDPDFKAAAGVINKHVKQESLKRVLNGNTLKQPQCHIYVVGIHLPRAF